MFTSPITLQPTRSSGLVLNADRLLTALQAHGYECEVTQLSSVQPLPPGLSLVLQFGDTITLSDGKTPTLVARCGVQIGDGRGRDTARWKVQKTIIVAEPQPISIVIEADVILSSRVTLSEVLSDEGDVYAQLGLLFSDLHHTIHTIPVSRRRRNAEIPAARLEARFFGDVVAGRSGLARHLKGERSLSLNPRQTLQAMRTGCEVLRNNVVFDLAGIVRGIVTPVQETDRSAKCEQRGSANPSQRDVQPIHRDHNEAALVPARASLP
jgi:hypothetical protein